MLRLDRALGLRFGAGHVGASAALGGGGIIFKYAPGDDISALGGTFARTGAARYTDENGIIQSAATGVLRDGHWQYVGGVWRRTTRLEDASENLFEYSEQYQQAGSWTPTRTTVAANQATAPDGTNTADALLETTDDGNHYIEQSHTAGEVSPWTGSHYVKANGRTYARLLITDNAVASFQADINLSNGSVIANPSDAGNWSGTVVRVEDVGDGWYRLSLSGSLSTSGQGLTFNIYSMKDSTTISYVGDVTKGLYLWGGQFEGLSFPTSPILTVGSAVTRNADSLYFTLPALDPPRAMTVYAEGIDRGTSPAQKRIFELGNTTTGLVATIESATASVYHFSGGSNVRGGGSGAVSLGDRYELAAQLYGDGSVQSRVSVNGGAVTSGSQTADLAFQSAWATATLYLNSASGGGTPGHADFLALKIALGVRNMAAMRTV